MTPFFITKSSSNDQTLKMTFGSVENTTFDSSISVSFLISKFTLMIFSLTKYSIPERNV